MGKLTGIYNWISDNYQKHFAIVMYILIAIIIIMLGYGFISPNGFSPPCNVNNRINAGIPAAAKKDTHFVFVILNSYS